MCSSGRPAHLRMQFTSPLLTSQQVTCISASRCKRRWSAAISSRLSSRHLTKFEYPAHLVDELQMAGHARNGLAAGGRLPQKHREIVRARCKPLRPPTPRRLIPTSNVRSISNLDTTAAENIQTLVVDGTASQTQDAWLLVVWVEWM